jgi:glycosyltransferase involved in cell wall biosynthesis
MKVLQIHNKYRFRGGEEAVMEWTTGLLKRKGIEVDMITRESTGLDANFFTKFRAFASSIYSLSAYRFIARLIRNTPPDVVHVHNLYPLLSPSVLTACRRAGIPVVMTCHNYRLICPIGVYIRNGKTCEAFCHDREYLCFLRNCRGNFLESGAYALRSAFARRFKLFEENVTIFITLTQFAKDCFKKSGIPEEKIMVLPNSVNIDYGQSTQVNKKEYIAYVGRISPEKGIETLLKAARVTGLPVRIAGDYSTAEGFVTSAPSNVTFVGFLSGETLGEFYRKASFLVFPSICNEMFPLTLLEAMQVGLPVISSMIGGLPEIVNNGVTGMFFEPGNSKDLANKMRLLWHDHALRLQLGQAGREKFLRDYSEDLYFRQLMAIYEKAISLKN